MYPTPVNDQPRRPDPELIATLRSRIQGIAGRYPKSRESSEALALGIGEIDNFLPWGGLPRACLHEIGAGDTSIAAAGFCARLLARLATKGGVVAWCGRTRGLYGPGLAAFGIDPARLIVVRARRNIDVFWAMEEGLRSTALTAVLGEIDSATPIALRRLQLAAEESDVTAVLLHPDRSIGIASPAVTRWKVSSISSQMAADAPGNDRINLVRPCWHVELQRCKGGIFGPQTARQPSKTLGGPIAWYLEWRDEAGDFTVVPNLRHRLTPSAEKPLIRRHLAP